MSKQFAIVNGLSKLFNKTEDQTRYDTTHLKSGVLIEFDVTETTVFFIKSNEDDHNLGYNGTYIYTHNDLFANYDNKGGQFGCTNIKNDNENDSTTFLFGKITPLAEYTPWLFSYHIQSYSSDTAFNSEFDVFLYGNGNKIYSYYAFNENGEKIPYCYHVVKQNEDDIEIGVCLYDTEENNTERRNISYIVNDINNCTFTNIELTKSTLNDCLIIDARQQGFVEQNNNTQIKIPNIHISKIENSALKNHPRTLYAFDRNGNIAPLASVKTSVPFSALSNTDREYNIVGFDYTRGMFYSNNYDGSLQYVEGNLFSSFSGIDFRYFDNVAVPIDVAKPIYIRGRIQNGLFFIDPIVNQQYKRIWTQTIDTQSMYKEEFAYWFIGYPQNTPEGYFINLFEDNKVYRLYDNKLIEHGRVLEFTPTGTISAPVFYGTEGVVTVSGMSDGTNSSSNVTINGTTASVNSVVDTGELPTIEYYSNSEQAKFIEGKLPEVDEQEVWVGYTSAVAEAQQFNGTTITLSGKFTPTGTISAPVFYGNNVTIVT